LVISKIVRFGIFRDIKNEGDNIEIINHMPALKGRTKSPKIEIKGKEDTVTIKKEPSKKRWKLLNDFKG
jgi:hypothetical protein